MRCAAFPAFIERQSKGIVACMWEQPVTACIMGTVGVHLALHAVHMDYIMRVHSTGWYGPTADHPGGWCKCFRGHALPALPPPPAAPAGRGRKRARKQKKVRLLGAWGRSLESVGRAWVHGYCMTLGRDAGPPPPETLGVLKANQAAGAERPSC